MISLILLKLLPFSQILQGFTNFHAALYICVVRAPSHVNLELKHLF